MSDGNVVYYSTAETWAYDPAANTWTELKPSGTVPPARQAHAMAYDPVTQHMILFGGRDDARGSDANVLTDTWAYDPAANAWTELTPSGTVPVVAGCRAASDPSTGLMVMFGGGDYNGPLNDTWAYDPTGNTWTELDPKGTLPKPRYGSGMAYDSSSQQVIMFGGSVLDGSKYFDDTWAYDPVANTWTDLDPSGTLPEARSSFGMVYDYASQRVIMFGGSVADGSKYFDDTWAYDPVANTWTELQPSGTLPSARCPGPLVYDPSTGRVLMFGGIAAGVKTCLNDIWAFTP